MHSLLTLNALPKVGPIRIRRLLDRFGTPDNILAQSASSLQTVSGIGPDIARIITQWSRYFDPEAELTECDRLGITLLTHTNSLWPAPLRNQADSPLLLYVKGEVTTADHHALAIVGSRRCTHYGRGNTRQFAARLTHAGYTIISGLARGIDTEAHRSTIAAGGRTIAVLGSGLKELYPPENKDLAAEISDGHGAVVTEFPLRAKPDKQAFPQRNRIVAAWSSGVLVTECPSRSGSLITTGFANDLGKPVFAIPGPIDRPQSEGCHEAIRSGAILVTHPDQILDELRRTPDLPLFNNPSPTPANPPTPPLNETEQRVLQTLGNTGLTIDQISLACGLPVHIVSPTLLSLEIKNTAKQLAGQKYISRLNL